MRAFKDDEDFHFGFGNVLSKCLYFISPLPEEGRKRHGAKSRYRKLAEDMQAY